MKSILLFFLGILIIHQNVFPQSCTTRVAVVNPFDYVSQFTRIETGWYDEWLEYTGGEERLPEPLPPLEKWQHPYMKYRFTSAMHEDAHASDVSNLPGPLVENARGQYFHVLQKGGDFSGMAPTYTFINDSTMITLSFGRANTTLLVLDIKDTIRILDHMSVPGRGNKAMELAGKKGRTKIFSNTAGGAYSYLSDRDRIYIPGADNNILRVKIINRKLDKENVESIDLIEQIEAGNMLDPSFKGKDALNQLTALMPDVDGNVWFTSRMGVIGLIHRDDTTSYGCPKVYASFVQKYGLRIKLKKFLGIDLTEEQEMSYMRYEEISPELRQQFREEYLIDENTKEEIQNSFSVGKDGVYIVSNAALYKFRFNEETKEIELNPKWRESLYSGDLIYQNDAQIKPGHLNEGSGTTPTLMGEDFVIIGDNDTTHINVCVYSQETGKLLFRHKLFEDLSGSAVENSMVAYKSSIIATNQYGYTDPFELNETEGGIMRFDYDEALQTFKLRKDWPKSGLYDCKTATPKLSTANGLIYVYNRSDSAYNGHYDWQVTAIDYKTGLRVFYIKPYLNKGEFDDNVGLMMKWGSLGTKNYNQKVFNNIWGTFTFGPDNSFYIGVYRGFIRISSGPKSF